jgi:ribosomal protein S18 acetylase RimI-like enzyme
MEQPVETRQATIEDLPAIAEVFIEAFPESVLHYTGRTTIPPNALVDAFRVCLDAEPEAFFVATIAGRVAGYIFAPTHFSRIATTAILHGHIFRLFWGWITGAYGVGFRPMLMSVRNTLLLVSRKEQEKMHSDGRILSIAVSPSAQGHGVGTLLMQAGLHYLQARGVTTVRLEVRPDNPQAIHLYEKVGFTHVGTTHDSQGEWLIMVKRGY